MNRNPNNWDRILWSHKLMGIRVVVKGVRFAGAGIAWRHLIADQAPYQSSMVFLFTKNVVFCSFCTTGIVGR